MVGQKVIYFENPNAAAGNSVVSVSPRYKGPMADVAAQAVREQGLPPNTSWQEVEDALDPVFKNARKVENGKLVADLSKSKIISHNIRRQERGKEFITLDGNNPNVLVTPEIETLRVGVRDKYAGIQIAFDNANSVNALKGLMIAQGWI